MKTFLTPTQNEDGSPFGPTEMEELLHARYYISRYTHTSYVDAGLISPMEREYILGYIKEEKEMEEKAINEARNRNKGKGSEL